AHAHFAPHHPVRNRGCEALPVYIPNESTERALLPIVVIRLEFEIADDCIRVLIAPVGKEHNVIAIERLRIPGFRLDHHGAIEPLLFLKSRMAVIPVGTALPYRKLIDEGLAGRYAVEC